MLHCYTEVHLYNLAMISKVQTEIRFFVTQFLQIFFCHQLERTRKRWNLLGYSWVKSVFDLFNRNIRKIFVKMDAQLTRSLAFVPS